VRLCGTPGAAAVAAALLIMVCSGAPAHGEDAVDPSSDAFSCASEARIFVQEHSAGEIRAARDRWLEVRAAPDEPAVVTAHRWCLVAELMRSLGDDRTSQYYARAIGATGDPGYELRLADYFRTVRGPRVALREQAEQHYLAALAGVRAHAVNPGASDDAIAEWATRALILTHQQDGLTLLSRNASSLGRGSSSWPSIAVMAGGRIAFDTNDTPVDTSLPAQVDDAHRFTSEAMFAASRLRKAGPLRTDELQAIARAPLRDEVMARARLRASPIGAIDAWYRQSQVHEGEITDYRLPKGLSDIALSELGAGLSRALDLAPAFDVLLASCYRRVHRVGVVESAPGQAQDFDMFEAKPTVARFLGPDKLSVAAAYTVMAIPDVQGGVAAGRARGRTIASLDVDYAMSRLLLPPYQWPALHVFAGVARDDETFGIRVVHHRDAYIGLAVPRLRQWDATVQASLFTGTVDIGPQDPAHPTNEDPQQSHAQYRTTVVVLRRLVDEDARPGLPPETHGVRPSMLNAVLTLRHDVAVRGLSAYENVRGGVELWAKVFVTRLRDTAVLMSVGYDNQYFYEIGKDLHVFHIDMRMGW